MKKCDIIIPVYNAYDYIKKCIETVIKNTDLKNNRLILINDKSPDERISKLLKSYEKDNILVYENEKNLGFVGTVNKGMKLSNNDVLLLNSDTEVPENWLENIKKCAYSKEMVATVTPLSNNATLTSVPKALQRNELPTDMSFEEYAKLVNEIAYNEHIEIPTGHGFCMYIRREAIDAVGYFDEEGFGKGYGEENDFCYRCLEYGFRNIICDNTIIFHNESKSFSESKEKLLKQGQELLRKRYHFYKTQNEKWCEKFPNEHIGKNINYCLNQQRNRKNILILIHDWKDVKNNHGGTTLHVYDMIRHLRDRYNFHVLAPEDGNFKLTSYWKDDEEELYFRGISTSFSKVNYYNSDYRKMLEKIVDTFDIKAIHIHHLKNQYFDVIDVIKEKKLKTIITLHDFYCLCPLINKLYINREYCDGREDLTCKQCINHMSGNKENMIVSWRREWERLLNLADRIIVPSLNTKIEILKTYPNLKMEVIEHGIDIKKYKQDINIDEDSEFNIAFVGAIGVHKGAIILEDLVKKVKNTNIKVHLFGLCDSDYLQKKHRNFINHGKYKRENLQELLKKNNIKLVCSFSIWPETYSYTLTESIACGVPVLALNIGAVAERIEKYNLGWLIPLKTNTSDIKLKIQQIFEDKKDYKKKISSINKYKIKTTKQMTEEYIPLYDAITKDDSKLSFEKIKKLVRESANKHQLSGTENVDWIFNSLKWRIVSSIKVPRKLGDFVRKIVKK